MATGNMTIAIRDAVGFKIIGVEMLKAGTMKAGAGGNRLVRTMNDLDLLAAGHNSLLDGAPIEPAQSDEGCSPLPWAFGSRTDKRGVRLQDATGQILQSGN
jgi:hypothetical protein